MKTFSDRKIFRESCSPEITDPDSDEMLSGSGEVQQSSTYRIFRRLSSGSSNFHSEKLEFKLDCITVKQTAFSLIFISIFAVFGFGAMIGSFFADEKNVFLFIFGLIFALLPGAIWFLSHRCRMEIDLKNKLFYPCGRKPGKKYREPIPLTEADYLYIIEKTCRGSKGRTYTCYELNLAMAENAHFNLLTHGARGKMMADAKKLSGILDLPLEYSDRESSRRSGRASKNSTMGLLIVGSFFLFIGILASYSACISPLLGYLSSQDWIEAPAVIRTSYVHSYRGSKGKTHYNLKIAYEYRYQNKNYQSKRFDYFTSHIDSSSYLRKASKEYPSGRRTVCYVNPANPKEAVLKKEFPTAAIFPIVFVNIFPAIGLILIIVGLCNRKKSRKNTTPEQ